MINKVDNSPSFHVSQLGHLKSTMPRADTFETTIQFSETHSDCCCIPYLKRLSMAIVELFLNLYELLKVLFCCKTEEIEENFTQQALKVQTSSQITNQNHLLEQLPLTEDEMVNIFYIFHTLANSNPIRIYSLESDLKRKGEAIAHVHPLSFLSYIILNAELLKDFHKLRTSRFYALLSDDKNPWKKFVTDMTLSLQRKSDDSQANLASYIDLFAETIQIPKDQLTPYFLNRRWLQLIDFIFDNKQQNS